MLHDYELTVNNNKYRQLYFLVDIIYSHWIIFASTVSEELSKKEELFSAAKHGLRKDVERAFGV